MSPTVNEIERPSPNSARAIRTHPVAPERLLAPFRRAVERLPNWNAEASGENGVRAVRTRRLFRFRDDVKVRVYARADGAGSELTGASRVGKNDLGQNSRNIKELLQAVERETAKTGPLGANPVPRARAGNRRLRRAEELLSGGREDGLVGLLTRYENPGAAGKRLWVAVQLNGLQVTVSAVGSEGAAQGDRLQEPEVGVHVLVSEFEHGGRLGDGVSGEHPGAQDEQLLLALYAVEVAAGRAGPVLVFSPVKVFSLCGTVGSRRRLSSPPRSLTASRSCNTPVDGQY
jgi:hypothetical protein